MLNPASEVGASGKAPCKGRGDGAGTSYVEPGMVRAGCLWRTRNARVKAILDRMPGER
ncbi:MAG TPA: hypothetical protein VNJ12_11165 [Candidatus Dormibacteraeota bacterium]|nr:hypothetical protein [Candidatus Dormibacteraeota bacterium]